MRSEIEVVFFLIGGGIFFLLGFLVLGASIYLSYFKFEVLLGCLQRSRGVVNRRFFIGRDPFSRFFVLVSIAPLLVWPKRAIKLGELNEEDYASFSSGLILMVRFFYCLALIDGFVLVAMWLVKKK